MDAKADILCHQVNCKGVMGAGLAKQIKDAFPRTFQRYRMKCAEIRDGSGGLGDVLMSDEGRIVIANLFAQDGYGGSQRRTDYDALRACLTEIRDEAKVWKVMENRVCHVAIPHGIGCGLAGGDWAVVRPMIEEIFGPESSVCCEIWKLPAGDSSLMSAETPA